MTQINCAVIQDFCTTCLHLHTSCVHDLSTSEAYLTNRAHTVVRNSHMSQSQLPGQHPGCRNNKVVMSKCVCVRACVCVCLLTSHKYLGLRCWHVSQKGFFCFRPLLFTISTSSLTGGKQSSSSLGKYGAVFVCEQWFCENVRGSGKMEEW